MTESTSLLPVTSLGVDPGYAALWSRLSSAQSTSPAASQSCGGDARQSRAAAPNTRLSFPPLLPISLLLLHATRLVPHCQ